MAQTVVQKSIVKFCIGCGAQFSTPQPEKDDNNIVQCGDGETNGCGIRFIAKKLE